MYYVIQKNIFKSPRYDEIFNVMEELKLDYEVVEFSPRSNDFDFKTDRKDVFVYGSVKLAKVTSDYHWIPGSFYGNNHEFENYSKGYKENAINYGSYICKLTKTLDWANTPNLFIKPSKDAKVFTGKVFNEYEWKDFVYYSLNDSNNKRISTSTMIQVSKPYEIIKEARIWIVNKEVITSSYYKFHGNVEFEENVAEDGIKFANKMAKLYSVADAYVMDIALTNDDWKIVEVNCINSAGFYKGNVKDIVIALEKYYTQSSKAF